MGVRHSDDEIDDKLRKLRRTRAYADRCARRRWVPISHLGWALERYWAARRALFNVGVAVDDPELCLDVHAARVALCDASRPRTWLGGGGRGGPPIVGVVVH